MGDNLELELVQAYRRYLEHLAGKHNQKSHGNKYGTAAAIKGNVKRLGKDKDALKRMAKRARGDKDFQAGVKAGAKKKKAVVFGVKDTPKPKSGEFEISTFDGYINGEARTSKKTVSGIIQGDLAIQSTGRGKYSLTHVPTGYILGSPIFGSKKKAVGIMDKLNSSNINWGELSSKSNKKDISKASGAALHVITDGQYGSLDE